MEATVALVKLSGEIFAGPGGQGYSYEHVEFACRQIAPLYGQYPIVIVAGGGNWPRGAELQKNFFRRKTATADYMGMLATVHNAIALQDKLENDYQVETRVLSSIAVNAVCEQFILRRALSHLRKGRVIILAGGTGKPGFTTDTSALISASELGANLVLKGTKVDGIYDKDPHRFPDAQLIPQISHEAYIERKLRVMDIEAVTHAMENNIPVRVFKFFEDGNLLRALKGEIGSVIR